MNNENELNRLKEELDICRKIIESQQHTIFRLIDCFVLEKEKDTKASTLHPVKQ